MHDNLLPRSLKLATKLINTQQQLIYLQKTHENNFFPLAITKQCKLTFSGHNQDMQSKLQDIFY